MVKGLFDFSSEPTRVKAEVETKQLQSAVPPVASLSEKPDFDWWKTPVYLATYQGFNNYCNNCPRLLEKAETKSNEWKYRVICAVPKCEKK